MVNYPWIDTLKNIQYFSILLILEACSKSIICCGALYITVEKNWNAIDIFFFSKPFQPNRMISRMTISFWIIFVLLPLKYTCPVQICELYFSSLLWSYSKNSEISFFLNFYFFVTELSKYIPEGRLDPMTFQNMMEAANMNYYLAKVNFLNLLKVISRKIWVTEKFCNFHIVDSHNFQNSNESLIRHLVSLINRVDYIQCRNSKESLHFQKSIFH